MEIGGFFEYEKNLPVENNGFFESLGGEYKFFMSGRCAIYYCLKDYMLTDTKRVAYLPVYTCETVLDNYVKAGYTLCYYDVNEKLEPIFNESYLDKISLLHICCYYGFKTYDDYFVDRCVEKGIAVLEDTTHSPFTEGGADSRCTYIAGSLRKWMGVECGGYAVKRGSSFQAEVLPVHAEHASARRNAILDKEQAVASGNTALLQDATDRFWAAEMNLRKMFDAYASNETSIEIMEHFPIEDHKRIRRENYQYLLDHLHNDNIRVVFPTLPQGVVPSHFTVYAANREQAQAYLLENGIHSTAYWPQPPMVESLEPYPQSQYVYDHIFSLPCDQRYGTKEMAYICEVLNQYKD